MLPWLIFEVGTVWFWLLLISSSIILITCVEYASPGWAILTLIAVLLALPRETTLAWFHNLREHPSLIVILFLGYLVAGTIWSIVKWWFYVRNRASKYMELERQYKNDNLISAERLTDEQKKDFLRTYYRSTDLATRPSPDENKRRILTWMIYWPWSALWTVIDEPIKKAFKEIYKQVRGLYERISASAYKNIDPVPVKKPE